MQADAHHREAAAQRLLVRHGERRLGEGVAIHQRGIRQLASGGEIRVAADVVRLLGVEEGARGVVVGALDLGVGRRSRARHRGAARAARGERRARPDRPERAVRAGGTAAGAARDRARGGGDAPGALGRRGRRAQRGAHRADHSNVSRDDAEVHALARGVAGRETRVAAALRTRSARVEATITSRPLETAPSGSGRRSARDGGDAWERRTRVRADVLWRTRARGRGVASRRQRKVVAADRKPQPSRFAFPACRRGGREKLWVTDRRPFLYFCFFFTLRLHTSPFRRPSEVPRAETSHPSSRRFGAGIWKAAYH